MNTMNTMNTFKDTQKYGFSIKELIIDYIYDKVEIGEHNYKIIKNIAEIYDLNNYKHYISANSCGINSLIICITINNKYYSYIIDRRTLSYNKTTLKKSMVKFSEIVLNIEKKYYNGTIFDGILIENEANKDNNIFVISDVFLLCGIPQYNIDYKIKMFIINNMIKKLNSLGTSTEFMVSKPYDVSNTKLLFYEYLKSIDKKKFNVKGIVFYPQYSGTKYIYIFDKQDEECILYLTTHYPYVIKNTRPLSTPLPLSIHHPIPLPLSVEKKNIKLNVANVKYSNNDKTTKFKYVLNAKNDEDIMINIEMIKTHIPDVYKLYSVFKSNKNKYSKKNIGISYIPTYELSYKCKNYFLDSSSIVMKCLLNIKKYKWIPIEPASINKIDIINMDERFVIFEETHQDSDV